MNASDQPAQSAETAPSEEKFAPARPALPGLLALAGLAQGSTIYAVQRIGEDARIPPELAAFAAFVCVGGFTLQLLSREGFKWAKLAAAAAWGLLWTIPFAWVFDRGLSFDFPARDAVVTLSAAASVFLAAPFLAGEFRYAKLFARICDNLLAAAAGLCVAAVSSLLVRLGAELFAILGIDFLKEWVKTDFFFWIFHPTLAGAGMALPVWRFRRLALMTFRLPAATGAAVALTFAAALLIVGPAPLWERNIAAPLLLSLSALMMIFAAAAFGEGQEETARPDAESGRWTRGILSMSLLTLPLFSGLAIYGIGVRIEQYGLTPLRVWGGFTALFLSLAALAYAGCALASLLGLRGEAGKWLGGLRVANPALVFAALAVFYFSNTPLMDPWRLSAESQRARVTSAETTMRDLDLGVFYEWGGYGLAGLEDAEARLRTAGDARAADLLAEMDELRAARDSGELDLALAALGWKDAAVYGTPSATAVEIVRTMKKTHPNWNLACDPPGECAMLALDLTGDAAAEHCLARIFPQHGHLDCFIRTDDGFARLGGLIPREGDWHGDALAKVLEDLSSGDWKSTPAAVKDVVIGGRVFFLSPNREDAW